MNSFHWVVCCVVTFWIGAASGIFIERDEPSSILYPLAMTAVVVGGVVTAIAALIVVVSGIYFLTGTP